MVTTLTLDKTGRIVLPKTVRDELRIRPGDFLKLQTSKDEILLRPVRGKARMYKKHGVWVLNSGTPLRPDVVEKTIQRLRRERERHILGK